MKNYLFFCVTYLFISNKLIGYSIAQKNISPPLIEILFNWNEPEIVIDSAQHNMLKFFAEKINRGAYSFQIKEMARQKVFELIKEKERIIEERKRQEQEDTIFRKYLASSMSSMKNDFLTMRY